MKPACPDGQGARHARTGAILSSRFSGVSALCCRANAHWLEEIVKNRIGSGMLVLLCLLTAGRVMADDTLGLPPGLINVDCDARQHSPVLLIHGTFANTRRAFSNLAPVLKESGHCLFAMNYGSPGPLSPNGTADINQSAQDISRFAQSVLARTGADKLSLVGHSQGGLLAFLVARAPELAGHVDRIVALAPSVHGTTRAPQSLPYNACPACLQQAAGSPFMQALRQQRLNQPGVHAFVLATRQDAVVTPVAGQFLDEPGVINLLLQDVYPDIRASHSGLPHVPEAVALVRDFLDAR